MRALAIGALGWGTATLGIATPAFAAGPPVPLQENGWLIYQDSHTAETIPCTPQPILLRGNHTTITLNGMCAYVRVAGEHNDISIQIAPAATIEITGEHNDVTWRQMVPGLPPRLLDKASSNTFHHAQE